MAEKSINDRGERGLMLEGAELVLYDSRGISFEVPLSFMQLTAIIEILGIDYNENGEMTYFTDESLEEVLNKTIRKLRPIE